ncbi:MAG: SDR family NAD(P)-dependent oxidoreductase [Pseudomonadota bacterium]
MPGQHFVITGANRGIGLELTRQAIAQGHRVSAIARDPDAAALRDLGADTGNALTRHQADVTAPDTLAAAAKAVPAPVDLLVCNAGQYIGRGKLGTTAFGADAWQSGLMTNVAGVFFTVEAFLGHLRGAARPRIAILSSIMGSSARAPGGSYIYRASKAAATNLARNLAQDLTGDGIAVGAYHPGWVKTDMGGSGADILVQQAVSGLLARFDTLSPETTGVFEDYRGAAIPF